MKKRIALIGLLLVLAISTAGNANARVISTGDKAPALAPGDTISPTGTTTSNVPQYYWYSVGGATNYHIKVKKGSKTVYNFKVFPTCGGTCWYFPAGILSNKDYKWKVRAYNGGWQPWSAWEKFTVNDSSGFKSSFNKNANGWTKLNGNWKLAKGKYVTKGQQGFTATSKYSDSYANFTYEVRMRRVWDGTCDQTLTSSIYLRGTPEPLTPLKQWDNGIRFSYNNSGNYSVYEMVNGSGNSLAFNSSSAINQGGWNTLLVVAKGSWYWLYINGTYIGVMSDDSHTHGLVGLSSYQGNVCNDKFKVDWVKLSESTPL